MEYRHGYHSVCNIEYHFVWITKYRYHVLGGQHIWARGYFCATVGQVTDEMIYIEGHVDKSPDENFTLDTD